MCIKLGIQSEQKCGNIHTNLHRILISLGKAVPKCKGEPLASNTLVINLQNTVAPCVYTQHEVLMLLIARVFPIHLSQALHEHQ